MLKHNQLFIDNWPDYELIDSGHKRKLERFGNYIINRPEPKAIWNQSLQSSVWSKYDAIFIQTNPNQGKWLFKDDKLLDSWIMHYKDIKFYGHFTAYGHVGFFPDKQKHWDIISDYIINLTTFNYQPRVLNLFGYSGVASLIAAKVGACVAHVDSSKKALNWAKENQILSHLQNAKIHFILDDVVKFVSREVKRNRKYDLIILDPPKYGHGIKNEVWDIDKDLLTLLTNCKKLLNESKFLLMLNTYSLGITYKDLFEACKFIFHGSKVTFDAGELVLRSNNNKCIIPQSQFCLVQYA